MIVLLHRLCLQILHRDIKLDNIIFRQTESSTNADVGQTGDLALLDFDMCLLNHTDPPRPPLGSNEISVVGTREYMVIHQCLLLACVREPAKSTCNFVISSGPYEAAWRFGE